MELKDFVAGTLTQIIEGIDAAKEAVEGDNVLISPRLDGTAVNKGLPGIVPAYKDAPAIMINFDVSLSTTEGTGTKAGIGVVTGFISVGTSGQSTNEATSLSRVQFSVPVVLQKRTEP